MVEAPILMRSLVAIFIMMFFIAAVAWSILLFSRGYFFSYTIVVFGDSLSDNGNQFASTNNTIPPPDIYPKGRWTNDKTWVEYVADSLNVNLRDMAFGGATADNNIVKSENIIVKSENSSTGTHNKQKYELSSVKQQLDYFLQNGTEPDKYQTTYMIWIENIIDSIQESLTRLSTSVGARKFLINNLPPLEITPLIQRHFTTDQQKQLKDLVISHNAQLEVMVKNFSLTSHRVTARVFDVYNLTNEILNDPDKYHFKNVKDPCLDYYDGIFANSSSISNSSGIDTSTNVNNTIQPCEERDSYLFWDRLHPTARAHHLLADKIVDYLKSPEVKVQVKPWNNKTH
ncbi:4315_t:CDS:2 [Ambispora gerdemannii]|uniref:4315_t:CDS:1 n=1 Tax=Ambispora gerdemannii TaxID=144530 RepID=A0A9N8ZG48_9GLOM|nr:4315_t:CDS:2 [Ambispora gerdemannii]